MGFLSGITSFVKEHSEVIHGVLDVAGFIPGVGAVADLANAGLYAAEGDYLNAGLSLVSAIPGIGDTVALAKKSVNAIKGGLKGLKGLKNINALKKAKGIKKALAGMRGKAKTGASRLKGRTKNTDEALNAIKDEIKEICTNGKCFTGDTLVYTSQGYKPVKEIRKGDEVYSRDEKTGETGLKEVVEVFCTTAHTIYHIWVNGKEEFKTTAYHPVYVQEQGWVTEINLREGDTIETMDGFVHITKVEKTRHEEAVPVYNFHVKDWVSYFVGKMCVYVHNIKDKHRNLNDKLSNGHTFRDMVDLYAEKVNSNEVWSWMEDFPNPEKLLKKEKQDIRKEAIKQKLIMQIPIKKVIGPNNKICRYADFNTVKLVKEKINLPVHLWQETDKEQFNWLNKKIGYKQEGYTWHHSEKKGVMELVPFGIHNIYNHNGGRTKGHWAYRKEGR